MKAQSSAAVAAASATQQGNKAWWTRNTMSYDWKAPIAPEQFSAAWFDEVDRRFIAAARPFAHDERPFGRLIPFDALAGKRVLEVGCGMGLHSELIARAGADLTAIDISPTSVNATRKRFALKGLCADIHECDAEQFSDPEAFDYIWSWGVIHHSSRTGVVVKNLSNALKPGGRFDFMVYNLEGMQAYATIVTKYLLGFWAGKSLDELLWNSTDGFLARYFTRDSLSNLCSAFFDGIEIQTLGQEADAIPLPGGLRRLVAPLVSDRYIERAVRRRGSFLFARASKGAHGMAAADRLDVER